MRAIRWTMGASCANAHIVFTQTPTMKLCVEKVFGLPPGRTVVVEPVPDLPIERTEVSELLQMMLQVPDDRRLLYVGNSSPYKNLDVLPAALRILRETLPRTTLFATISPLHPLARCEGVTALGHVPRGGLSSIYELATALVMPSLVETVGLPMLEAASCGLAIVAADRPYARDVCESGAAYFNPLDPGSLAAVLARVLTDGTFRSNLRARASTVVDRRVSARPYDKMVDLLVQATLPRRP